MAGPTFWAHGPAPGLDPIHLAPLLHAKRDHEIPIARPPGEVSFNARITDTLASLDVRNPLLVGSPLGPRKCAAKMLGYSNETRPSSHRVFPSLICTLPFATSLQGHRFLRASKVLHSGSKGAGMDGICSPRQGHFTRSASCQT